MRAVILANGDLPYPEQDRARIGPGDLLIGADGGASHCLRLDLKPSVVIGDLDSLAPEDRRRLEELGVPVFEHPARKESTDLELAVRYAVEHGAQEVLVLAGLGSRWDQSVAAILLGANADLSGIVIRLASGRQEAQLLRGGQSLTIRGRPGDTVSLLPVSGDARGITTDGLEYRLSEESLVLGGTRGISNALLGEEAKISLREGLLLCVHIGSGAGAPGVDRTEEGIR